MHDQSNDQPVQIPEDVRAFLEGILQDSGMVALDDGMREEMIKELFARLDVYLTTVIVDNLSSDDVEKFIMLNQNKKSRDEIESFLKEKLPNNQELFQKGFANFRDMYLGNVAVYRNKPDEVPSTPSPAPTQENDTNDKSTLN
jgi:hypothetical protein